MPVDPTALARLIRDRMAELDIDGATVVQRSRGEDGYQLLKGTLSKLRDLDAKPRRSPPHGDIIAALARGLDLPSETPIHEAAHETLRESERIDRRSGVPVVYRRSMPIGRGQAEELTYGESVRGRHAKP